MLSSFNWPGPSPSNGALNPREYTKYLGNAGQCGFSIYEALAQALFKHNHSNFKAI